LNRKDAKARRKILDLGRVSIPAAFGSGKALSTDFENGFSGLGGRVGQVSYLPVVNDELNGKQLEPPRREGAKARRKILLDVGQVSIPAAVLGQP
jgi:hypothetical protein